MNDHLLYDFGFAQTKMHSIEAGGCVSDGAGHLIVLGAVFGLNLHHGSDSVAVAPGSFETKREPVIRFRADVLPQFRRFAQ